MVKKLQQEILSLNDKLDDAVRETKFSQDIISKLMEEIVMKQVCIENQSENNRELKDEVKELSNELNNTKVELSNQ